MKKNKELNITAVASYGLKEADEMNAVTLPEVKMPYTDVFINKYE